MLVYVQTAAVVVVVTTTYHWLSWAVNYTRHMTRW